MKVNPQIQGLHESVGDGAFFPELEGCCVWMEKTKPHIENALLKKQ